MTNLDSFFLIITAVCLSLFFIILTFLAINAWVALRKLIKGAETAFSGVEAATSMLRNAAVHRGVPTLLLSLVKYLSAQTRKPKKS